ncbi:hypothetical protein MAR_008660 [Mya arenaria]|uniref:Uncharacterized protein n=1 Tax=Mya arenaria TaxID=6604 RepID=A0ABY7DZ94_MYAAR|nr:hypothetical protein MAR_008660 [Mya arenaria]
MSGKPELIEPHLLRTSGEDQASTGVPPQLVSTKPASKVISYDLAIPNSRDIQINVSGHRGAWPYLEMAWTIKEVFHHWQTSQRGLALPADGLDHGGSIPPLADRSEMWVALPGDGLVHGRSIPPLAERSERGMFDVLSFTTNTRISGVSTCFQTVFLFGQQNIKPIKEQYANMGYPRSQVYTNITTRKPIAHFTHGVLHVGLTRADPHISKQDKFYDKNCGTSSHLTHPHVMTRDVSSLSKDVEKLKKKMIAHIQALRTALKRRSGLSTYLCET